MPPQTPLFPQIIDRLKSRGMRLTKSRERVIAALLAADRPLSAEEVRAQGNFAATDLVTVYRNLEALLGVGVLQRVPLENGSHLFELTHPDEHYHHIVCRRCHRTERLELCLGDELTREARARDFSDVHHVIEVYGLCAACRAAEPGTADSAAGVT